MGRERESHASATATARRDLALSSPRESRRARFGRSSCESRGRGANVFRRARPIFRARKVLRSGLFLAKKIGSSLICVNQNPEFEFRGVWLPRRNAPQTRSASVGIAESRCFSASGDIPFVTPYILERPVFAAGRLVSTEGTTMFDRITFTPGVMGGRACLRGMRITVSLVVNLVANGMTTPQILAEYPDLEPADVEQALKYASFLASEETLPATGTGRGA